MTDWKHFNPLMHNFPKRSNTLYKSCSICCKIFKVCLTILDNMHSKDIGKNAKNVSAYKWNVVSEGHNELGMEDGSIPDESITATSYIEDYFPWYDRVNRTRSNYLGAAWCTNITSGDQSLTVSTKPWFLLCFNPNFNSSLEVSLSFIYWIIQFGRFSKNLGIVLPCTSLKILCFSTQQFANKFLCEFSIED